MVTAGIDRQGIKLITDADLEGGVSDEDDLTYLLGIIDKQGSQVEDVDETKKTLPQITKHFLSGKKMSLDKTMKMSQSYSPMRG